MEYEHGIVWGLIIASVFWMVIVPSVKRYFFPKKYYSAEKILKNAQKNGIIGNSEDDLIELIRYTRDLCS